MPGITRSKRRNLRSLRAGVWLLVAGALFAPQAQALGTEALVDVVIQAIEPQLAPAKPLILCLIGGNSLQGCVEQELKKQAAALGQQATDQAKAALPFNPDDSRIAQIAAVARAASQGKWLEVVSKGGTTVGKIVACAALPPGVKSVGCPVTDYVIDNNKQLIDDAWKAARGPDWWGLVKLLGPQTACQFIPVAEIKSTICGPLGQAFEAAVAAVEEGAEALGDALGDASELVVDFSEDLAGQSKPMAPDKYFNTYWSGHIHWYLLAALKGASPGVSDFGWEYDSCVEYYDNHKASLATAKKWCGKLRGQAQALFKAARNGIEAYPSAYIESRLKPQLPQFVLESFHAQGNPMTDKLYNECRFDVVKTVPITGVLPQQDPMKSKFTNPPYTGWEWACMQVADTYKKAFHDQKSQLAVNMVPGLMKAGCVAVKPGSGETKLRFICDSWEGLGTCKTQIAAVGGEPEAGHCGLDSTPALKKLAAQVLAQLGSKRCSQAGPQNLVCTRPWKVAKCQSLVDAAQGVSVADSFKLGCAAKDDPAFIAGQAEVKNLLFTVNGGVGAKTDAMGMSAGQGGAWSPATQDNCKSTWDPLTVVCNSPEVVATHNLMLPACAADANQDGADAPCLVSMVYDALKETNVTPDAKFDGPLEPATSRGGLPPPAGTGRSRGLPAVVAPTPLPPFAGRRVGPAAPATLSAAGVTRAIPVAPAEPAAMRAAPSGEAVLRSPPAVDVPGPAGGGLAPAPATPGRSAAALLISGCELRPGQPGAWSCTTREALNACERQRIANPAAVSSCQLTMSRARP